MAKDDVNALVALASNFLAPFSLFLAAHSLHPPDHPSLPHLLVSGVSLRSAGNAAAAPALPLAASSSHKTREQQTLC